MFIHQGSCKSNITMWGAQIPFLSDHFLSFPSSCHLSWGLGDGRHRVVWRCLNSYCWTDAKGSGRCLWLVCCQGYSGPRSEACLATVSGAWCHLLGLSCRVGTLITSPQSYSSLQNSEAAPDLLPYPYLLHHVLPLLVCLVLPTHLLQRVKGGGADLVF